MIPVMLPKRGSLTAPTFQDCVNILSLPSDGMRQESREDQGQKEAAGIQVAHTKVPKKFPSYTFPIKGQASEHI